MPIHTNIIIYITMNKQKINNNFFFIDWHCHILPNIDDGAKSIEESIQMAKVAQQEGFSHIFATPHYSPYFDKQEKLNLIEFNLSQLVQTLKSNNIDISIYKGYELYLTKNIIYQNNFLDFSLGNTHHILVEFGIHSEFPWFLDFVYEMNLQGIEIILAHPERYPYLFKNKKISNELRNAGVLFQIDAASIFGAYGKKIQQNTKKLLKMGNIDLLGSDAHRPTSQGFYFSKTIQEIKKYTDQKIIDKVVYENPKKIISQND